MTEEHARPERRRFVDVLRGLAITLMVINHTARWWLDPAIGPAREAVIYVSMALAGPAFLFLVGFSLALSRAAADGARQPVRHLAARHLRRAFLFAAAGLLVNAVAFHDEPLASARVLVSIALALVVALPVLWVLPSRVARLALVVAAAVMVAAFGPALPRLAEWSTIHPTAARLLLREFPLFPWLALVFVGLTMGWMEATREAARRPRHYVMIGAAGVVAVAGFLIHELGAGRPILDSARDFVLNGFWTAGPVTAVGIMGMILGLTASVYVIVEIASVTVGPLVILGRAALMVYVVHLVIVIPVGHRGLGLVMSDWPAYAIATLGLLVLVTGLAGAWRRLRTWLATSLTRRRSRLLPRHV